MLAKEYVFRRLAAPSAAGGRIPLPYGQRDSSPCGVYFKNCCTLWNSASLLSRQTILYEEVCEWKKKTLSELIYFLGLEGCH
jgi:hypothetical protein